MNLVKLYTHHGPQYVSCDQLADLKREQLSKYTSCGNKLYDVLERSGRLKSYSEGTTVHRANLFATRDMAIAHNAALHDAIRRGAV